jgi:hypothetical protein
MCEICALTQAHPRHGGPILAAQSSWTLSTLIGALNGLL